MTDTFDADVFTRNKSRYLSEHYSELAGKHVAWAFDGSAPLAVAPSIAELRTTLGDDAIERCIFGYVDPLPVVTPAVSRSRAS